jgi:hypothetical protein
MFPIRDGRYHVDLRYVAYPVMQLSRHIEVPDRDLIFSFVVSGLTQPVV